MDIEKTLVDRLTELLLYRRMNVFVLFRFKLDIAEEYTYFPKID